MDTEDEKKFENDLEEYKYVKNKHRKGVNNTGNVRYEKLQDSGVINRPVKSSDVRVDLDRLDKGDDVNHPAHYNNGEIECIDAIEAMLTSEEFIGYLRGNSLKYRWRFRYKKQPVEDMMKAGWYEEKLLQFYKKSEDLTEKTSEYRQKNGTGSKVS
tara:strand:+ start:219 stop:686 length:468 start_codon:yes stop_codon:yes gene_type:complete